MERVGVSDRFCARRGLRGTEIQIRSCANPYYFNDGNDVRNDISCALKRARSPKR